MFLVHWLWLKVGLVGLLNNNLFISKLNLILYGATKGAVSVSEGRTVYFYKKIMGDL